MTFPDPKETVKMSKLLFVVSMVYMTGCYIWPKIEPAKSMDQTVKESCSRSCRGTFDSKCFDKCYQNKY